MARKRRKFTDHFKAQVALEALRGDRTVQEIATRHGLLPTQVSAWKKQAMEGLSDVFAGKAGGAVDREAELKDLHAKIGRLAVENDFSAKGLKNMSPCRRKNIVQPDHPQLSLSAQCRILGISRSSLYYRPVPVRDDTLALMKSIDRLFTAYPFFGSRQMVAMLKRDGLSVGRHRIRRLMRRMGLEAVYRRPKTSQPHPAHPIHPYLLRTMTIDRPNQVWCADITFVPVSRGYLYVVAIMDWATRKVLSWRLSNTMHADFCVEALNEAIRRHGPPEIVNTDQGSQFTGSAWITTLTEAGVRISMDGRGRCMDNIFIERLWRSMKYEAVYLQDIADGFEAGRVVDSWIDFYNRQRPHSALGLRTPDEAYLERIELTKAA
ncbi:IS3 family transposase [Rhodophyticola porphyridii]|uniref:IS3 family transposase n=1 Tax=Rhodophyticola porphyridii TaxID=1852017 RepID=UPI0035CE8C41